MYASVRNTKHFLGSILLTMLFCPAICAQITGTVLDGQTNQPISASQVFINRTSIGSITDAGGRFQLTSLPTGLSEIVVYKEGYTLYRSFIKIQPSKNYNINIALPALGQTKHTRLSKEELGTLDKLFFGATNHSTSFANGIEKNDKQNLIANEPVLMINEGNGYKIQCFLTDVPFSEIIYAPLKFEILPYENISVGIQREKSRSKTFKGSLRHWLSAIAGNQSDNLGYTVKDESGKSIEPSSLITHSAATGYFRIESKSKIIVRHKSEEGEEETIIRVVDLADFNPSGVLINPKSLLVEGSMAARGIVNQLPNDFVPIDNVEDEFARSLNNIFEKVYIHTDKPYYYPSEQIWWKAYMNYFNPDARHSLSKTLYVEIVDRNNKMLQQKKLKLDSGFTNNNFALSDSTKPGEYFIRAYTSNQRNFGDQFLCLKSIYVLAKTVKPAHINEDESFQMPGLQVVPDKKSYGKNEKVIIDIILRDSLGKPLPGHFSISVTDASQVLNIGKHPSIVDQFPIQKQEINNVFDIHYPIEKGLTFKGRFVNGKNKVMKTELGFVQFQPYQLSTVTTDDQGLFEVDNLDFTEEAAFSIHPLGDSKIKTGQATILDREYPALNISKQQTSFQTVDMQTVQRILSEYEKPANSKMLEEVTVRGERDKTDVSKNVAASARPYGVGDYVFDESKIKMQFPNLLYTLQALNISGMVVNPYTETIFFSRNAKPVMSLGTAPAGVDLVTEEEKRYSPLVTLDNMPLVGGSAGEILASISPAAIGSIEVTKSGSAIRGTFASFGIIAVYTKKGLSSEKDSQSIGPGLTRLRGYAESKQFQHPSYEVSNEDRAVDFRSTLYWNPSVSLTTTGEGKVYFYTSSLTGLIRIEVEGVDARGRPLRTVSFFTVKD